MKNAILTIDDIASKNTKAIVDYLVEKNIKAVMFAWGQNVEREYDSAVYALKAGMIVGNHSFSHPAFSSLSFEQCINEIEKNEALLDKLYKDAGVERKYRPFRFPYGDKGGANKEKLQEYFREKGFNKLVDTEVTYPFWSESGCNRDIDTLWTFDFEEYRIRKGSGFTLEDVWKKVNNENQPYGGNLFTEDSSNIIIMHAHDETEELVPEYYKQFIDRILDMGIRFEEPRFF